MRRAWFATTYLVTGGATAVASAAAIGALAGALGLSLVLVGVALLAPAVRPPMRSPTWSGAAQTGCWSCLPAEPQAPYAVRPPGCAPPRVIRPPTELRLADRARHRRGAARGRGAAALAVRAGWADRAADVVGRAGRGAAHLRRADHELGQRTAGATPARARRADALRWAVPVFAVAYALAARASFAPSSRSRLERRVTELTATRAGALDAHAAELRRIERDLHDGAQARLVAIAMRLGVAQRQRRRRPGARRPADRAGPDGRRGGADRTARRWCGASTRRSSPTGACRARCTRSPPTAPVPLTVRVAAAATAAGGGGGRRLLRRRRGTDQRRQAQPARPRATVRVERAGGPAGRSTSPTTASAAPTSARGTGLAGIRRRVAALDGSVERRQPGRRADGAYGWSCRARRDRRGQRPAPGGARPAAGTAGFEVAAAVGTTPTASSPRSTRQRPDVAIVDVRLPPTFRDEGLRAALRPAGEHPGLPVLVLSQYVERDLRRRAARRRPAAASATCSRTGCAGSTSSSTRCVGSPPAAPRWTRGRRATRRRPAQPARPPSPRANARCSR